MSMAAIQLDALLELMRRLRDPQRGCAWDRVQDFATIAPYTIEEAYEVAEAIALMDPGKIRDELGDLLFQVVFHARMAEERGWFGFADVAESISAKLIRRHPHVFSEQGRNDEASISLAWEAQKAQERRAGGSSGTLADVPRALPALTRAEKLGRRAARVGFDWPDAQSVTDKVREELDETLKAIAATDQAAMSEEVGDLLFSIANWARHLHVNPEQALQQAARKFELRFAQMEQLVSERALVLESLSAAQWDALWSEAKLLTAAK
jgi:nucleoside triphosphate diphosphatase